ncbi:MAG: hypothetical protein FJ090_19510 [Deltaproteobacteria bacterium]|nr:hypothetical protein [Deltaproteobacteria bacterium]
MRACFARGGALGDFVLAMPVLKALCDEGHEVHVACSPRFRPLVDLCGQVARIWDIDAAESAWMLGGDAPVSFDLAVCFTEGRGRTFPCRDTRWVTSRPPEGARAWAHFASVYPCDPAWHLAGPRQGVVIAPGASSSDKTLPLDWWLALHRALPGSRLVGGPLEPWAAERPDLPGLVALARATRVWIGPDTGPTHLAARCGSRVIAVATSEQWIPLGSTWMPMWSSVDEILAAVDFPVPATAGGAPG